MASVDSDAALAASLGASGAIANARDLAAIYAGVASPETAPTDYGLRVLDRLRMASIASAAPMDETLRGHMRFSNGFMVSTDNRHLELNGAYDMILGRDAFGMPGFGGNIGFADPRYGLAMGYVTNDVRNTILLNRYSQRLVDEVYVALGCKSNDPGCWI